MRLLVVSHKPCWRSPGSASGVATDGGFPLQMRALSELFDETTVAVPVDRGPRPGEMHLVGDSLGVLPLTPPLGRGLGRKLLLPFWVAENLHRLKAALRSADAVHAPIPGDVGTIGMLLAGWAGKPLFVRHCGNWLMQRTAAERFWRSYMERNAGGRNVMFATGGGLAPPSDRNGAIRWIFSSSLTRREMAAVPAARGPVQRLITVARQERGKGTDRILEALPLLKERFPGLGLDVVGDGGALESLRKQAGALGVEHAVVFHGRVGHARVMDLLAAAHLFCFPTSCSEGFPKVVLEALAQGLPVVTTPVSVLPHLMSGGGGVILEGTGPEAIASAVEWCLADPARYGAMSRCALETARGYPLERWRSDIGRELSAAWGPLRAG